jgi:hypothetical protein
LNISIIYSIAVEEAMIDKSVPGGIFAVYFCRLDLLEPERIDRFTMLEAPDALPVYEDPYPLGCLSQVNCFYITIPGVHRILNGQISG